MQFHEQADKINYEAHVGHRSRNKSIIAKFRNAWRYHVQVLCTNKLPLYFWKFSQHGKFDCNLKVQKSMPSLAPINIKKACMKNELHYVNTLRAGLRYIGTSISA